MEQYLYFCAAGHQDEYQLNLISELNEMFDCAGIVIEVENIKKGNRKYADVKFKFDTEKFNSFKTRNAGRPTAKTTKVFSVKEIRERMENDTAENVATDIGISRATLFRKLKYADEHGMEYL